MVGGITGGTGEGQGLPMDLKRLLLLLRSSTKLSKRGNEDHGGVVSISRPAGLTEPGTNGRPL